MIALRQVTFARVGRPLVIDASVQLHTGWKVGVVGANGCGKSSLFALLSGELHAESGDVELPASWHIARVAQETPALPDSALDFVLDGDVELRRVERELVEAEARNDGEAIGHLHDRYGEIGGYSAKARVAEVLHGLGFTDADFQRSVSEFSGGWRVRLNLARALSCRADLLLLDEPTNHLDIMSQEVLQSALESFNGTILLVTHDRYLVDRLASQVWELRQDDGPMRLEVFMGPYQEFLAARTVKPVVIEAVAPAANGDGAGAPTPLSKNEQRRRAEALAALEAEIAATEMKLIELSGAMQTAAEIPDYAELMRLTAGYEAAGKKLEILFDEWGQMTHEPAGDPRTDG